MGVDVLGRRALNRATLERQWLLRRQAAPVSRAVEHLVGLQAQEPPDPYVGLWSRLDGFDPEHTAARDRAKEELSQLLLERAVVRLVVMRATIHLVTANDALRLRPLFQPVLDAELARHRDHAPALRGIDLEPVLAFARELLAEQPRNGRQLRAALAARFPDLDAAALAYACRNRLALVQVPPRGMWGRRAQVTSTTVEAWLGRPLAAEPSIDEMVLRYLAAFGPATAADVATWSRLTGLREVIDRLRPRLRTFRDERGRDLVDLPGAPRPDPETPAPPRFLPGFDNLLLSHADRSRFQALDGDGRSRMRPLPGPGQGSVLADGAVQGTWRLVHDGPEGAARLVISLLGRLTGAEVEALATEGRDLARFLAPGASDHDVRLIGVD